MHDDLCKVPLAHLTKGHPDKVKVDNILRRTAVEPKGAGRPQASQFTSSIV